MSEKFAFGTSLNQPTILENYNLFASDAALQTAIEANGGAWNNEHARKLGEILGSPETLELGTLPIGIDFGKIIARSMPKAEENYPQIKSD